MQEAGVDRGPRTWPAVTATALALLAWSTYAYLTERINGDMVAEVIQVQRLMADPQWVWSYPGQRHGGILEYPLIALAESIAPGNVYGFTLVRILYVPIAGVLLALAFRYAFPRRSLWPFAAAAAAGPAILHGMKLISDIYPLSFLLAAASVWVAYWAWHSGRRGSWLVLSGALCGLGIYEHPASALGSLPLLVAGAFLWSPRAKAVAWWVLGLAIGLIPQLLALFGQPDRLVVYNPTGLRAPDVPGILGVVPQDDAWTTAIVPNGWGLQHADETLFGLPPVGQVVVNALLVVLLVALIWPVVGAVREYARRQPISERQFIAVLWAAALLGSIALVCLVPPIWFYGTPLGFAMWWTIPLLPFAWDGTLGRRAGIAIGAALVVLIGSVSLRAVLLKEPVGLAGAEFKLDQAREVERIAQQISDGGVDYLYGSYWEVLPLAYASSGKLHPITNTFNRFPLPQGIGERITVAVPSGRIALPLRLESWTMADEALKEVQRSCRMRDDLTALMPDEVVVADCPVSVLVPPR